MRKDENQIGAMIVSTATAEKREKNPYAVALARQRAAKLSPERRSEIAAKAAAKRWSARRKKKR